MASNDGPEGAIGAAGFHPYALPLPSRWFGLGCTACDQQYPVRRGVPRMLTGQFLVEVQKTVDGFGYEWTTFNEEIQNTYMTSKTNFLDFIYPTTSDFFAGTGFVS